ncbi:helix-turn-helix transcriptional regulator [Candidatus Formimonas warabiya]|uniref:HTH araC/xylS-type domain-containing protein n=1 Tax=Formimonas warabiya TaxID=1761012 RepID=A0A3G1KWK7_FORW1|nr:AraC family transcriptional regulator [Candidatus Formimonas warabiya]ATW26832.1 hypothetical protein DCMF_20555 [Candidatus Formimonas warabiya]
MAQKEWRKLWHHAQLNIELYQSFCLKQGFPLHMHDYYVICFIEKGLQSFTYRKTKHLTPTGGIILLNPGEGHTGEPADDQGFEYRALYPTISHMKDVLYELTGRHQDLPFFRKVQVDNFVLAQRIYELHQSLTSTTSTIESESLFLLVLTKLIQQYADVSPQEQAIKKESFAVQKACDYIYDHSSCGITLTELARHVCLSRFYLLRVFHEEKGISPHAFLESIRINHAKHLLEKGYLPIKVASEVGFSDQSHFTNRFKRFIGVTPGQYQKEIRG